MDLVVASVISVRLTSEVFVHFHLVVFLLALLSVTKVPCKCKAESATYAPTFLVACKGIAMCVGFPFASVE